ncbi:uncharacterized protein si:dkey-260g12.1 isoform X2 [Danio aesculapii]|uniref:uncharacterized protein si:dkey-260g12.1 isoform X2 n=1 Tax=Danio aesculapii TaxID=1142201 RepID=UPI0024C05B6F|nr:uncharacterized protein si:dkey-260g12.1 isoform X2 [Danio aesculapii]
MSSKEHSLAEDTEIKFESGTFWILTTVKMRTTVLSVALVMLTGHLINGFPMNGKMRSPREASNNCSDSCPAGFFKDDCKCLQCDPGFFNNRENEDSCTRCFQRCTNEFKMEEVKECTTTSDVVCRCQQGYTCASYDQYTGQCESCVLIITPGTTPDPTPDPTPSPQSYISADVASEVPSSITSPKGKTDSPIGYKDYLVWTLFGLISSMLSIIILTLFLRFCSKKEKECLKHIVRQCSLGGDVDSEVTPPSQPDEQPHTHEMLSDVCSPTNHNTDPFHQPVSQEQAVPPAGNLGPLHIYGPQTVFVSLLNHFAGEQKAHEQGESLNSSNMSYPQSPPVHLSEEERSGEDDFIFFPSQEQGKECHISKEEML